VGRSNKTYHLAGGQSLYILNALILQFIQASCTMEDITDTIISIKNNLLLQSELRSTLKENHIDSKTKSIDLNEQKRNMAICVEKVHSCG